MTKARIAVVGAGLIGRSWTAAFARAGHPVRLYDPDGRAMAATSDALDTIFGELCALSLMRKEEVRNAIAGVECSPSLEHALAGAVYVQESAPETIDAKVALFEEMDRLAASDAILASSTSAMLPSQFLTRVRTVERCLVAHPLNPPHLIPAVEIVPAPRTAERVVRETQALLAGVGQKPILVAREVEGFVMNRLQGALLDEAFMLLQSGLASVHDIDAAVKDGLARRWTLMGPFETIDLNAPGGVGVFIDRYGPAYEAIGRMRPDRVDWHGPAKEAVVAARRAILPAEEIGARQAWRDRELAALTAHLKARSGDPERQ